MDTVGAVLWHRTWSEPRRRTSFRGDIGQMALSQEFLQRPGHDRLAFGERLTTIRNPGVIEARSLGI